MKQKLTRYELEKQKRREMAEDAEYLRNVDGENGVDGQKFVMDWETSKENNRRKEVADVETELEGSGIITYLQKLAEYGQKKLESLEETEGWRLYCVPTMHNKEIKIFGKLFPTKEGIQIILRSPMGKVFARGIQITRDPAYDVNAIDILIDQVDNTIDSDKGLLLSDKKEIPGFKTRKSGLILPS